MCGIAGLVGTFYPGLAARMNAAQAHRGPDGSGIFEDPDQEVCLGHVRLAILDLTDQAAQPMHSDDSRWVLVFNGEIYNFADLRPSLQAHGHRFRSTGDTEVLLKGLQEWGEDFVPRLNGMFAFALWDGQNRRLLLARDPLGVKPLYYVEPEPGCLLFASEIKALCAYPGFAREPDYHALFQHLAFCHASGTRTALRGVRRLPPGAILCWDAARRQAQVKHYWRPPFHEETSESRDRAVLQLRQLVRAATRRQLVSDVPVGVSLSGGLDSSLLAALAAQEADADFRGYTVAYAPEDLGLDRCDDDAPRARALAASLGLKLHEIEIRPDVAALWPALIHYLDEPIADPAAIACYLVSKLAREEGAKVLLSGQGADELFGGYPRYSAMQLTWWADSLPVHFRRAVSQAARLLPGSWGGPLGVGLRRARRVAVALDQQPDARFLAYCASTPEASIRPVLSPAFRATVGDHRFEEECFAYMQSRGLRGLARQQDRDLCVYLPNHNLLYLDKTAMAVGLEGRVPLLDLELVDTAARYPAAWKLLPGTTKVLLRLAARGLVPREILTRPKAGFGAPYRKWLRHDLDEMWNDLTSPIALRNRGWFEPAAVERIRQQSQRGHADLYMLQWALLTVELWARQFLDRNPADARRQMPRWEPARVDTLPAGKAA